MSIGQGMEWELDAKVEDGRGMVDDLVCGMDGLLREGWLRGLANFLVDRILSSLKGAGGTARRMGPKSGGEGMYPVAGQYN